MDKRLEQLFVLREEFQLEIDPEVKKELRDKFFSAVEVFLATHHIRMTPHEFIAATAADYKNWRRNPH